MCPQPPSVKGLFVRVTSFSDDNKALGKEAEAVCEVTDPIAKATERAQFKNAVV